MKKATDKKPRENKKLEELQKLNEEYFDRLKRLKAEFDNYQKRMEKEKAEFKEYASSAVIKKLLDILDNFERAIGSFKNDGVKDEHVHGLEMVYKNVYKTLEEEGLKAMSTLNEKFDPYKHEVVSKMKSDKPEGTVIEELQKGYMFKSKVLRHAKVIISAGEK